VRAAPTLALVLASLILPSTAASLPAQGTTYEIDPANGYYLYGCTGPSICLCPVAAAPGLAGSFTLVLLLPPLGPIFEYSVVDFEATAPGPSGTTLVISGGGLYTIDLAANTQTLVLDVLVDGAPAIFETIGAIEAVVPFPDAVQVDVYHALAPPCLYEGLAFAAAPAAGVPFVRGDANEDGSLDISDAIIALSTLFPSTVPPAVDCLDAADSNDDGNFDIADPVALLAGLFGGGSVPPPPFPGCGTDPTADSLGCVGHDFCP